MWAQACQSLREAGQRQLGEPSGASVSRPAWEPPVDVFEDGASVVICVALPGIAPEKVQLDLLPDGIIVRAERAAHVTSRRVRVRQLEIPRGLFERRIALAPGRYELDELDALHGCVVLRLRRQ